jgi:hypothetical protein
LLSVSGWWVWDSTLVESTLHLLLVVAAIMLLMKHTFSPPIRQLTPDGATPRKTGKFNFTTG